MAYRGSIPALQQRFPSFGFSGSGFLACYHLGATKCLLEQGQLQFGEEEAKRPVLTGVSGGALNVAGLAAGVDPEAGMETALHVARRTREEGLLDAFRPGFSLLDQVEHRLLQDMRSAINNDDERFLRRIEGGKLLRIGLSERLEEIPIRNPRAYCFVDQFRDIEDVLAACMLSSFIPGVTGPLAGSSPTISRASTRVREMMELGFIKKQLPNGEIVVVKPNSQSKSESEAEVSQGKTPAKAGLENYAGEFPLFLDGGLSNAFPVIDEKTVLVTPMCGVFEPNMSISPESNKSGTNFECGSESSSENIVNAKYSGAARLLHISDRVKIHLSRQNAQTLRRIVLSSDDENLQQRYRDGYDDAKRFLKAHSLTKKHSCPSVGNAPLETKKHSPTLEVA